MKERHEEARDAIRHTENPDNFKDKNMTITIIDNHDNSFYNVMILRFLLPLYLLIRDVITNCRYKEEKTTLARSRNQ